MHSRKSTMLNQRYLVTASILKSISENGHQIIVSILNNGLCQLCDAAVVMQQPFSSEVNIRHNVPLRIDISIFNFLIGRLSLCLDAVQIISQVSSNGRPLLVQSQAEQMMKKSFMSIDSSPTVSIPARPPVDIRAVPGGI